MLVGFYRISYIWARGYEFCSTFPCSEGIGFHLQMPETLTYTYPGIWLHIRSRNEGLLIESQSDGKLVPAVMDPGFSDQCDDIIWVRFEDFFKESEDLIGDGFIVAGSS